MYQGSDDEQRHDGLSEHARLADELLAVRCLLGERQAIDTLVARWHEPLWSYLRSILGDDDLAADAMQAGWLRILRALPSLRDPARLRPWLFGIIRRTAMDRLRARYAELPHVVDAADVADTISNDTQDDESRDDDLAAMHHELAQLPALEREVLVLFYLKELSLAQIADVLAVPVGTVKSRLWRARTLLRQRLEHSRAS